MGDRPASHWDGDHVATRPIDSFAHRFRHFVGLPGRKTHATLTISHRDQRVEREAASALDDLRDTIDRDDVLDELATTVSASAFAIT
jgi:hypothetical protein